MSFEKHLSTFEADLEFLRVALRAFVPTKHEAEAMAGAIMTVLEVRGVDVPDRVNYKIFGGRTWEQYDTWLRRAVTATTAEEVVA
jgi:hypothetical protein